MTRETQRMNNPGHWWLWRHFHIGAQLFTWPRFSAFDTAEINSELNLWITLIIDGCGDDYELIFSRRSSHLNEHSLYIVDGQNQEKKGLCWQHEPHTRSPKIKMFWSESRKKGLGWAAAWDSPGMPVEGGFSLPRQCTMYTMYNVHTMCTAVCCDSEQGANCRVQSILTSSQPVCIN